MAKIEDMISKEAEEQLKALGAGSAVGGPTAEQELTVHQALSQVQKRGKSRKHRPGRSEGPIRPDEFRDLLHSQQTIDEVLGNKQFVDGVFAFIQQENKAGEYQAALGELVSKYKTFDTETQKNIRVRLAAGKEIPDRKAIFEATKNGLTSVDELAIILFYDDPSAFEANANRSIAGRKRIKNWVDKYNKVWSAEADSADAEERAEIMERAKEGKASTAELARVATPVIGTAPKSKTKRAKLDRMSAYTLLADMFLLIGHPVMDDVGLGQHLPLEERINLQGRIQVLACKADARFEGAKLDLEIEKRRLTLKDRVAVEPKPTGKEIMDELKEDMEHSTQ